jgi:pyruvate dehydrogenase E2 component (dihydrolipoamide acetyltransferase)
MAFEFKFPDVGEGITEGELLAWKVAEGDTVAEDQTLAEVETDKAVVEMPSPRAGRVTKLFAEEGDVIEVGQVLVVIDEDGAAAPPLVVGDPAEETPPEAPAPVEAQPAAPSVAEPERASAEEEAFYTGSVVGMLEEATEEEEAAPAAVREVAPAETGVKVLAMPSVRALAKELGVDLSLVHGTGQGGRILRQDVEDHAESSTYGRAGVSAPSIAVPEIAQAEPWMGGELGQDNHGVVERVAFRGVRRTMARHMAESVAKQAQVTTTDDADVSILRRIREKERTLAAERGVRLTYVAFVVKACAAALRRFPRMNSVLQETCDELLLKRYYNIGIAVDTKAGLVVPNIKDADRKSIFTIAEEVVDLVERAQDRKLELSDLHGGTFTITNYGAIGGVYATPVTNYPEVAILGMGRVRDTPVVRKGEVVVHQMLALSLTYDHQVIDGAEAARFLNMVIGYLEDPDLLLLEGV